MWKKAVVVVPALTVLILLALPQDTISAHADPSVNAAQQIVGRDVYSPDVLPDPSGNGYIMWYGGWQTEQRWIPVNSTPFTGVRLRLPTAHGRIQPPRSWASQVSPQKPR